MYYNLFTYHYLILQNNVKFSIPETRVADTKQIIRQKSKVYVFFDESIFFLQTGIKRIKELSPTIKY